MPVALAYVTASRHGSTPQLVTHTRVASGYWPPGSVAIGAAVPHREVLMLGHASAETSSTVLQNRWFDEQDATARLGSVSVNPAPAAGSCSFAGTQVASCAEGLAPGDVGPAAGRYVTAQLAWVTPPPASVRDSSSMPGLDTFFQAGSPALDAAGYAMEYPNLREYVKGHRQGANCVESAESAHMLARNDARPRPVLLVRLRQKQQ